MWVSAKMLILFDLTYYTIATIITIITLFSDIVLFSSVHSFTHTHFCCYVQTLGSPSFHRYCMLFIGVLAFLATDPPCPEPVESEIGQGDKKQSKHMPWLAGCSTAGGQKRPWHSQNRHPRGQLKEGNVANALNRMFCHFTHF